MKKHKEPDADDRKGYRGKGDGDADDRKRGKHMEPKGKRGKAQVERLGRSYKTGNFEKIEEKAAKKYGSKESGERVAGAIFNKMAREHAGKK